VNSEQLSLSMSVEFVMSSYAMSYSLLITLKIVNMKFDEAH